MADSNGQSEIRGLNIQKYAVAYMEEALVFKNLLFNTTTSNREIRWYQKTATSPVAEGTTGDTSNVAYGALPFVVKQSFTRNTSYTKKYFAATPMIDLEDLKDNDVNIWTIHLQDVAYRISYDIDADIWNVLTENQSAVNINAVTANAAWDTASWTGVDIVEDVMEAIYKIRINSGYDPLKFGGTLVLSPKDHTSLLNWLISAKGSYIPNFSSNRIQDGIIQQFLGLNVMVSNNVTADYAVVLIPSKCGTYYSFGDLQTAIVEEQGVGKAIRIWAEGISTLDRPKCVSLISNTQA